MIEEWRELESLAYKQAQDDYMRSGEISNKTREMFRAAFWMKTRVLLKAYNPEQVRIPAGQPGGGQWAPDGGGEGQTETSESITLAANDGTPGPNDAQNKQTNDVGAKHKLDYDQRRELHNEVSKQDKGFKGVDEDGKFIKDRDKDKVSKDDIRSQRKFKGKNRWGF